MALLDRGLTQRIVGALVLLALSVIFLPMLFTRQDVPPALEVSVPARPEMPEMPRAAMQPADAAAPQNVAVRTVASESSHLDADNLPISWSIQLASLSSRPNAESLMQKLRVQGYNAYIRTFDGMNRVFVGPLIERSEAERLRDQLNRQQNVKGFVVRFQPERQ